MAIRINSAVRLIKGEKLCTLLVILQYFVSYPSANSYIFVVFLFCDYLGRDFLFLGFGSGNSLQVAATSEARYWLSSTSAM